MQITDPNFDKIPAIFPLILAHKDKTVVSSRTIERERMLNMSERLIKDDSTEYGILSDIKINEMGDLCTYAYGRLATVTFPADRKFKEPRKGDIVPFFSSRVLNRTIYIECGRNKIDISFFHMKEEDVPYPRCNKRYNIYHTDKLTIKDKPTVIKKIWEEIKEKLDL